MIPDNFKRQNRITVENVLTFPVNKQSFQVFVLCLAAKKRLPLDTWNLSEPQGNVFGNRRPMFDSSQTPYQGIRHSTNPSATGAVPVQVSTGQSPGRESSERGPVSASKTDRLHDLRLLSSHSSSTRSQSWCRCQSSTVLFETHTVVVERIHIFHTGSSSSHTPILETGLLPMVPWRSTRSACFFSHLDRQDSSSRQRTIDWTRTDREPRMVLHKQRQLPRS